jgi:hypothetical protein
MGLAEKVYKCATLERERELQKADVALVVVGQDLLLYVCGWAVGVTT